nr:RNA-dependent RNA polymerase [Sarcosphaera coronaria partitivirus]
MPFTSLRNYLAESVARLRNEWKNFQSSDENPTLAQENFANLDTDNRRYYNQVRTSHEQDISILNAEYSALVESMRQQNTLKHENFEFFKRTATMPAVPENRIPAPGLESVPVFYHTERIITADPATSRALSPDNAADYAESYLPGDTDYGEPLDPLLQALIYRKYPEYIHYVNKYTRPAGTTDATFRDFNKEQKSSAPYDPERLERIMPLIDHFLNLTPYLPVHFVDTLFAGLPKTTGTGYHNRHSFKNRAHAKYSHPKEYSDRTTSKGYFINATYEHARRIIHNIKDSSVPFDLDFDIGPDMTDEQFLALIQKLNSFFNSYPTLLFTRNHISDRDGTLKVRPVYAVDDLFIIIELMLCFPITVQARKPECCIMYGLETLRGANHLLDNLARSYEAFFTIDWSGYDQRLPRVITDIFFTRYLRSKIVISHGYQPTYEYPTYPDLDEHKMYERMDNLLHFLHLWYNNMTFLSTDGYAYRRKFAGVPSGLYLTQFLDSFANLFLLIDAFIEYGMSDDQIKDMLLFILGDDNSGFTHWTPKFLSDFVSFLESYALKRWNMVLSKTKSVLTTLRSKIETLSYRCNHGMPTRDIPKLVAQLCYPEHGIKHKTMSARAIGLAYASCGQDLKFHQFCKDVHSMFLPFLDLNKYDKVRLARQMPGPTSILIEENDIFNWESFPSLQQVRKMISTYWGPLAYTPKWNRAHFINMPDVIPPSSKTMYEYEQENDLTVRSAPYLLHVNQIDPSQVKV